MNEQELRMWAIQLAGELFGEYNNADDVVEAAETFYKWVKEGVLPYE